MEAPNDRDREEDPLDEWEDVCLRMAEEAKREAQQDTTGHTAVTPQDASSTPQDASSAPEAAATRD